MQVIQNKLFITIQNSPKRSCLKSLTSQELSVITSSWNFISLIMIKSPVSMGDLNFTIIKDHYGCGKE